MPEGRTRLFGVILRVFFCLLVAAAGFGLGYWAADPDVVSRVKLAFQRRSYFDSLAVQIAGDPKLAGVDARQYADEWLQVKTIEHGPVGRYATLRSYGRGVSGRYVATNDHGLRSDLSLLEMAAQARRNSAQGRRNVLLLGSSAAFGEGALDDARTIAGYLAAKLPADRFQVFNLAQGGYICGTELAMLSLVGVYLEPDYVLVMDGFNDAISTTYDWPYYKDPRWLSVRDREELLNEYYTCLDAMARQAGGPGRRVILSLQPLGGFRNDAFLGDASIGKMWEIYPYLLEVVKAVAAGNENAGFLDLTALFQGEPGAERHFYNNIHLSSPGQEKVAAAMAGAILDLDSGSSGRSAAAARRAQVRNILDRDLSGAYTTARIPQ